MNYTKLKFMVFLVVLLHFGCSESNFKGSNSAGGSPEPAQVADNALPGCDLTQDFVQLENLPQDFLECERSGGFFFHVDRKCYNFSSPKTTCTLDMIKSTLTSLSIPSQTFDNVVARNPKVTDCRNFQDKKAIVVNLWLIDQNQKSCTFDESLSLVTACYRVKEVGEAESVNVDQIQAARNCLNAL